MNSLEEAKKVIAELEAEIDCVGDWFSVDDHMPPSGLEVLCTWVGYAGNRCFLVDEQHGGRFTTDSPRDNPRVRITHWMEIPRVPK